MEIKRISKDGIEKTAIAVGKEDISIPKHLITGEKRKGYIIDGRNRTEWYWDGFTTIDGVRYIYFDALDVVAVEALSTELRDRALDIVRTIALGLMDSSVSFLDLTNGVFPLSRILIIRDGRVLLLPPDIGDIMGNAIGGKNLAWFLDRSSGLVWDLSKRSPEERDAAIDKSRKNSDYAQFMGKAEKTAKRNAFWRVKGTIITVSAIAAIAILGFAGNWLYRFLQPPATAGMEQEAIIEALYDAQNNLDTELLTDAVKGCRLPQEMEVTSLYVTTRTRMAYEAINPVVSAAEWTEAGKPAIPDYSIIYGVVVDSITQTDENNFIADVTWFTPYAEEDDEEHIGGYVYLYHVQQSFEFEWNRRGWWNITDSEIIEREEIGREAVEHIPSGNAVSQQQMP